MIDVDGIREVFKRCGVYDKENTKNFIIRCPYCGDKSGKFASHKHSHCYVSKVDTIPVFNCFFCQKSGTVKKLLFDLTGDRCDNLIVPVETKRDYETRRIDTKREFKLPDLQTDFYPLKAAYMKKRTFGQLDLEDIPNLIFDIAGFFRLNGLDERNYVTSWELQYMHNSMVGFLSKRQTMLYCRAISQELPIKFKKVELQPDAKDIGLDYYAIDNGHLDSNLVVLSEGNFDILGCRAFNTLSLNDRARVFAAGCTFSYEELLKSVCLDYSIYRADVVILSDSDKSQEKYKYFVKNSEFYVNSMNIYYNQYGKDFGMSPQRAVKLF